MTIKEIEKLREKVDKDPNSKLYVPLAEEYRKEGMLDEAITVLQKGLEKQPGYMSARVSLGKIYLEKGQMAEARAEFENVVKTIPDNLYAHKKLGEIYRDTGEKELAIKSFGMFLKLNPMDEDALNNLRLLEGTAETAERTPDIVAPVPGDAPASGTDAVEDEAPLKAMSLEQAILEQESGESGEAEEDLDAFKESLFGFKSEGGEIMEEPAVANEVITEETPAGKGGEEWSFGNPESDQPPAEGADTAEAVEEESLEIKEPVESAEEFSIADSESGQAGWTPGNGGTEGAEEDGIEIDEPVESEKAVSFADIADALKTDAPASAADAEAPKDEIYGAKAYSRTESIAAEDSDGFLRKADVLISEGNYLGAINLYQRSLAATPDDKKTFQRIEELRSLLKLMGKDKEVLISKLSAFQGAIKKRGDEFFRRS